MMAAPETSEQFDVFLCHNSKDKGEVIEIAERLERRGLRPWLDEWELPPGVPWLPLLEERIGEIKSAAVFVGIDGLGPWQEMEIQTLLREFVRRKCPVIPTLLPAAPQRPELPLFLKGMTWVDFRPPKVPRKVRMTSLDRLIWGITGTKPLPVADVPAKPPVTAPPKATVSEPAPPDPTPEPEPKDLVEDLGNGVRLEMVRIPDGKFWMGQTEAEKEALIQAVGQGDYQKYFTRELPRHEVKISAFCMGKFPVTQAQWRAVAALPQVERALEADPAHFKGDRLPVEQVSWRDAVEFCARLSQKTGRKYRLPSEAEWEYACRAGTTTPYYFGDAIAPEQANFGNNKGQTTEVGTYPANAFGLHDMHGNVWEWCADDWHKNYESAPTNGSVWCDRGQASTKVLRGGSWVNYPWYCRSTIRDYYYLPVARYLNFGFRVVSEAARA